MGEKLKVRRRGDRREGKKGGRREKRFWLWPVLLFNRMLTQHNFKTNEC